MAKKETIALEHAEPGTGPPPIPRREDPMLDRAVASGSRRDSPPAAYIPPEEEGGEE